MRCEEFESRLNEILDRRRHPRSDAELWLHANSCSECGELLAGYQTLLSGLRRRAAAAAPADMPTRVQLQLAHPRRRGAWRDRAPLALVAAALVLAAALPGLWTIVGRTGGGDARPAPTLATTQPVGHRETVAAHANSPLSVLGRMAGDQVRFLAVHSEQSAVMAWRLVPSVEDVIEGIEGTASASRRPASPTPDKPQKPRNSAAVDAPSSASG